MRFHNHICPLSLPFARVELDTACVSRPKDWTLPLSSTEEALRNSDPKTIVSPSNPTPGECSHHVCTALLGAEDTPGLPAQKRLDTVDKVFFCLGRARSPSRRATLRPALTQPETIGQTLVSRWSGTGVMVRLSPCASKEEQLELSHVMIAGGAQHQSTLDGAWANQRCDKKQVISRNLW